MSVERTVIMQETMAKLKAEPTGHAANPKYIDILKAGWAKGYFQMTHQGPGLWWILPLDDGPAKLAEWHKKQEARS